MIRGKYGGKYGIAKSVGQECDHHHLWLVTESDFYFYAGQNAHLSLWCLKCAKIYTIPATWFVPQIGSYGMRII